MGTNIEYFTYPKQEPALKRKPRHFIAWVNNSCGALRDTLTGCGLNTEPVYPTRYKCKKIIEHGNNKKSGSKPDF